MLDKPEFDCNNLGEFYDCGCSDDEEQGSGGESTNKETHSTATRGDTPSSHNDLHDHLAVEISKEASVSPFPPVVRDILTCIIEPHAGKRASRLVHFLPKSWRPRRSCMALVPPLGFVGAGLFCIISRLDNIYIYPCHVAPF